MRCVVGLTIPEMPIRYTGWLWRDPLAGLFWATTFTFVSTANRANVTAINHSHLAAVAKSYHEHCIISPGLVSRGPFGYLLARFWVNLLRLC